MFSFDCWIRTADPHLIYDSTTKKRVNSSRSVFLGDHVWIGQHAMILKGSMVGSGSIIAAMTVLAGKTIESNSCYGGNPAKRLTSNVFFTKQSVHNWKDNKTKENLFYKKDTFVYSSNSGGGGNTFFVNR